MIYLAVATILLALIAIAVLSSRRRPKPEEYAEMEARRRAIEALHRI